MPHPTDPGRTNGLGGSGLQPAYWQGSNHISGTASSVVVSPSGANPGQQHSAAADTGGTVVAVGGCFSSYQQTISTVQLSTQAPAGKAKLPPAQSTGSELSSAMAYMEIWKCKYYDAEGRVSGLIMQLTETKEEGKAEVQRLREQLDTAKLQVSDKQLQQQLDDARRCCKEMHEKYTRHIQAANKQNGLFKRQVDAAAKVHADIQREQRDQLATLHAQMQCLQQQLDAAKKCVQDLKKQKGHLEEEHAALREELLAARNNSADAECLRQQLGAANTDLRRMTEELQAARICTKKIEQGLTQELAEAYIEVEGLKQQKAAATEEAREKEQGHRERMIEATAEMEELKEQLRVAKQGVQDTEGLGQRMIAADKKMEELREELAAARTGAEEGEVVKQQLAAAIAEVERLQEVVEAGTSEMAELREEVQAAAEVKTRLADTEERLKWAGKDVEKEWRERKKLEIEVQHLEEHAQSLERKNRELLQERNKAAENLDDACYARDSAVDEANLLREEVDGFRKAAEKQKQEYKQTKQRLEEEVREATQENHELKALLERQEVSHSELGEEMEAAREKNKQMEAMVSENRITQQLQDRKDTKIRELEGSVQELLADAKERDMQVIGLEKIAREAIAPRGGALREVMAARVREKALNTQRGVAKTDSTAARRGDSASQLLKKRTRCDAPNSSIAEGAQARNSGIDHEVHPTRKMEEATMDRVSKHPRVALGTVAKSSELQSPGRTAMPPPAFIQRQTQARSISTTPHEASESPSLNVRHVGRVGVPVNEVSEQSGGAQDSLHAVDPVGMEGSVKTQQQSSPPPATTLQPIFSRPLTIQQAGPAAVPGGAVVEHLAAAQPCHTPAYVGSSEAEKTQCQCTARTSTTTPDHSVTSPPPHVWHGNPVQLSAVDVWEQPRAPRTQNPVASAKGTVRGRNQAQSSARTPTTPGKPSFTPPLNAREAALTDVPTGEDGRTLQGAQIQNVSAATGRVGTVTVGQLSTHTTTTATNQLATSPPVTVCNAESVEVTTSEVDEQPRGAPTQNPDDYVKITLTGENIAQSLANTPTYPNKQTLAPTLTARGAELADVPPDRDGRPQNGSKKKHWSSSTARAGNRQNLGQIVERTATIPEQSTPSPCLNSQLADVAYAGEADEHMHASGTEEEPAFPHTRTGPTKRQPKARVSITQCHKRLPPSVNIQRTDPTDRIIDDNHEHIQAESTLEEPTQVSEARGREEPHAPLTIVETANRGAGANCRNRRARKPSNPIKLNRQVDMVPKGLHSTGGTPPNFFYVYCSKHASERLSSLADVALADAGRTGALAVSQEGAVAPTEEGATTAVGASDGGDLPTKDTQCGLLSQWNTMGELVDTVHKGVIDSLSNSKGVGLSVTSSEAEQAVRQLLVAMTSDSEEGGRSDVVATCREAVEKWVAYSKSGRRPFSKSCADFKAFALEVIGESPEVAPLSAGENTNPSLAGLGIGRGDGPSSSGSTAAGDTVLGAGGSPGLTMLGRDQSAALFQDAKYLDKPKYSSAPPVKTALEYVDASDWKDRVQLEQCCVPNCRNTACYAGHCIGIECTRARCAACEEASKDKFLCSMCSRPGMSAFYAAALSRSGDIQYASIVAGVEDTGKLLYTVRSLGNNGVFDWDLASSKLRARRSVHVFAFVRLSDGELQCISLGQRRPCVRMDAALRLPRSRDLYKKGLGPAVKLVWAPERLRELGTPVVPKIALDPEFLRDVLPQHDDK